MESGNERTKPYVLDGRVARLPSDLSFPGTAFARVRGLGPGAVVYELADARAPPIVFAITSEGCGWWVVQVLDAADHRVQVLWKRQPVVRFRGALGAAVTLEIRYAPLRDEPFYSAP